MLLLLQQNNDNMSNIKIATKINKLLLLKLLLLLDIFQLHLTICPSTETYFGLYLRGAMSTVTGIYLFRLQLNIIFFALRLTNSAYPDEMRRDGISPVCKCKKPCTEKYISRLKCSRIYVLKLFLIPYMYAFTSCNLRCFCVQFDYVFVVNISSSSG